MLSKLSGFLLKLWGWKVLGPIPQMKKYICIVVPHTSAWDFPIGVLLRSVMRRDIKFVAKKSLFVPPLGWILKAMNGVSVDRSKNTNFVDAVVNEYNKRDEFAIQIAPEGTREKVEKLKTGFYYIAKNAGIPIIMIKFDFANKEVVIREPFEVTDDMEKDFEVIHNYFRGTVGKRPEKSFM